MGKKRFDEPQVYVIPKNFLDSGYVFGGRFKSRNFIEAAVLTAPVLGVFIYGWEAAGWKFGNTIALCVILCGGIFMAAVSGIGGDSLLEFLKRVQNFRQNKQISKYNPRVKLENKPDFLTKERQSLPREKLLGLVKDLEGKILGDDGLPVSADISDARLILYFKDDEGFVEKPDQLKTRAELKAEAKAAKRKEKERKKQDMAFVKTLPRKERREARKRLKLEARARIAETKRAQNEERLRNEALIKAYLEAAQEKKKALAAEQPPILPKKSKKQKKPKEPKAPRKPKEPKAPKEPKKARKRRAKKGADNDAQETE